MTKSIWDGIEKMPVFHTAMRPIIAFLPPSAPSTIITYSDGHRKIILGGGPSSLDLVWQALAIASVLPSGRSGTVNFVTSEGVPASRIGTGRAISIYGAGEVADAGFTDMATEAQFANGRPLTSTLPDRAASDIALRDAPLSATTRGELQRLAQ